MYESATLRPPRQLKPELEAESNLIRCMSDASLVKRRRGGRGKSQAQRERERQHRFSINGHFYNYKAGPTPPHPQAEATPPSTLCPALLSPLCSSLPHPQTSIFTPSFGASTKVRISSRMTTDQVIVQLLNKFKVSCFGPIGM